MIRLAAATGRPEHHWSEDGVIADRVRSELGPVLKSLDHPHVHVAVVDGIVSLHGDAADGHAKAAIESTAVHTAGVRGLDSHLHLGLGAGDSRPSAGHHGERSALLTDLDRVLSESGLVPRPQQRRVLRLLLGAFAASLPPKSRDRLLDHLPADVRRLATPLVWRNGTALADDPVAPAVESMGLDHGDAEHLWARLVTVLRAHAPGDKELFSTPLPVRDRTPAPVTLTAADAMSRRFVSVPPEATLFAAFDALARHHVHHLPVVGRDGRCSAILDTTALAAKLPEAVARGSAPLLDPDVVKRPLWVLAGTSLRRVAAQMTAADVDACCVVDKHGRMIGLVTARDIVAAIAGQRPRSGPDRR